MIDLEKEFQHNIPLEGIFQKIIGKYIIWLYTNKYIYKPRSCVWALPDIASEKLSDYTHLSVVVHEFSVPNYVTKKYFSTRAAFATTIPVSEIALVVEKLMFQEGLSTYATSIQNDDQAIVTKKSETKNCQVCGCFDEYVSFSDNKKKFVCYRCC